MAHNKKEDNLENIISNEDVTDLNDNSTMNVIVIAVVLVIV